MLWIEKHEQSCCEVTLKLEGHLLGDWVSVLEDECRKWLQEEKRLTLEMAGVTYVNQPGLDLLRRLTAEKVELANCSCLIENLL